MKSSNVINVSKMKLYLFFEIFWKASIVLSSRLITEIHWPRELSAYISPVCLFMEIAGDGAIYRWEASFNIFFFWYWKSFFGNVPSSIYRHGLKKHENFF